MPGIAYGYYNADDIRFDQIRLLKRAYDEGFLPESVLNQPLATEDDWFPLHETIFEFLVHLYDGLLTGRVENDFPKRLNILLGEEDDPYYYSEHDYYILRSTLLNEYFTLYNQIESKVEPDVFKKLYHSSTLSKGVVNDYIDSIFRSFESETNDCIFKNGIFEMVMLVDNEQFMMDIDIVWWSHSLLKLVKEKIPLMKKYLEALEMKQSA